MADTIRTKAELLALFADNITGDITPQDMRDFVVSNLTAESQTETVSGTTVATNADVFVALLAASDVTLPAVSSYGNRSITIYNLTGGSLTVNAAIGDDIEGAGSVDIDSGKAAILASPEVGFSWVSLLNTSESGSVAPHTHVEADITDLDKYTQSEVNNLVGGVASDLIVHENLINNPHSVTAAQVGAAEVAHTHVEADITDLGDYATVSQVTVGLGTKADTSHSHVKADITDFSDGDYATAAQGSTADSALQSGDNVSTLTNDAGYITSDRFMYSVNFARSGNTSQGNYLKIGDVTCSISHGFPVVGTSTLQVVGIQRTDSTATTVDILVNGVVEASIATAANNTVDDTISVGLVSGDVISVRNTGSGGSTMSNAVATLCIEGAF